MIKTILITLLLFTLQLFSKEVEKPHILKKGNITIEVSPFINLTQQHKDFPLDLEGKLISRHVLISTKDEMKEAIETHLTTSFNKVIIECVYRRHCEIDKDIDFLLKLKNHKDFVGSNNMFIKKHDGVVFNLSSAELLTKPEIFMNDISYKDLELVEDIYDVVGNYKKIKNQWIFQEVQREMDVITNMYIEKFFFIDLKKYKQIVTDKIIPRYLSSLVGSNYCKVDFTKNNEISMDKKCDIVLYNYADRENLNFLFVNTYFMGVITKKKIIDDRIIYTVKDFQGDISKYFKIYDEKYSQKKLNIYQDILDLWMDNKDYNKYTLNEKENKTFKEIREQRLNNFLELTKVNNFNELEKEMNNIE